MASRGERCDASASQDNKALHDNTWSKGKVQGKAGNHGLQQFLLRGFMDADGLELGIALAKRHSNERELLL